jgi:hypothetical protein
MEAFLVILLTMAVRLYVWRRPWTATSPAKTDGAVSATSGSSGSFCRSASSSWAGRPMVARPRSQPIANLRCDTTQDIWVFGGAHVARGMLDANLIDQIERFVISLLVEEGKPLLLPSAEQIRLRLDRTERYSPSGEVEMVYRCASLLPRDVTSALVILSVPRQGSRCSTRGQ